MTPLGGKSAGGWRIENPTYQNNINVMSELADPDTVYVDQPIYRYRRMKMCHMMCKNLDKLHEMADKISVNRKWFQNKTTPHYDICKSKRTLALQFGAEEFTSREQQVEIIKFFK